jgi:hypothetical protein
MYFEMCGIDHGMDKTKATNEFYKVKPLPNNAPFERVEESETEVWHPDFLANIDTEVNALFVKTIVIRIWENEEVSQDPNVQRGTNRILFQRLRNIGKGEIPEQAFTKKIITDSVKVHWRSVHREAQKRSNEEKYLEGQIHARRRARRVGVRS